MINRWIKTYTLTLIYTDWYSNSKLSPLTEWIDIKCFFNAISISKRNSLRHWCHQSKRWAEWGQLLQCLFILQGGISGYFISVDCWQQKHRICDEKQRRGVGAPSTSLEVVVREQAASHIFRAFSLWPRSLKHCQEGKQNKTHTRCRWNNEEEGARGKHSSGRWTSVARILCSLQRCAKFGKFDRLLSIFHHWALSGLISATALKCSPSCKDLCIVLVLFFPPSCTRPTGWAGDGGGLQGRH